MSKISRILYKFFCVFGIIRVNTVCDWVLGQEFETPNLKKYRLFK